ncbi:bifunctional homocysteine S-methyltransferase/methylenetetrahydrofolate reductase [Mycobacterium deserti]|uniref:Bifunctional homocysteine S-methyltransferase/methylenetetrahydrofolate reductase n=1 Tax=Mycobacterium deserti TaxID=2978347 RepID=A0ABT2MEG1_9MYCO|nr:bifunctional homocysteine S-methyltransferase/methylenetetrahydrofolate reductase [Mycobacterium deserti]MCT7660668.1 bifunctional homocysteine S-methyltransferase/methylenetetrahydrofolate reductase [Mycobacterium deserti]
MTAFLDALNQRLVVCDGAMATMLHAAGNSLDRALPELNVSKPDAVKTVHDTYVDAGVDLILTNTFGAGRLRLAEHGASDNVVEINRAGVQIARDAANATDRQVFVGGSIGPAVSAAQRPRIPDVERKDVIAEQICALVEARVDVLVLETFGFLAELVEAVHTAAGITDLPIVAQATFTTEGKTPGGDTPRDVAVALSELPVAGLGANCTVGPQRMHDIVRELRRWGTLPISAQPNAGLPRRLPDRRFEYALDHDYFVRYARRCIEAGASMVGGCCGTTPMHIRALTASVKQVPSHDPPTRPSATAGLSWRSAGRDFVVAAEITPPGDGTSHGAIQAAGALRADGCDVVLVSAVQGAQAQLSSTSLALHLQQETMIGTIATITTWDKTIMSLQADLLGAHALGTRTVLCETGNPPLLGDYPNADGIWEVDSVGLIGLLSGLNAGRDCHGLSLATKTEFVIGARCNPGAEDLDAEIERTRAKISAGAQFLITRAVYEVEGLRRLVSALGENRVPVLATVSALSGFAEAEYLAYEVPDVTIPPESLAELAAAGTAQRDVGTQLATYLVTYLATHARSLADGIVIGASDDPQTARALLMAARR